MHARRWRTSLLGLGSSCPSEASVAAIEGGGDPSNSFSGGVCERDDDALGGGDRPRSFAAGNSKSARSAQGNANRSQPACHPCKAESASLATGEMVRRATTRRCTRWEGRCGLLASTSASRKESLSVGTSSAARRASDSRTRRARGVREDCLPSRED